MEKIERLVFQKLEKVAKTGNNENKSLVQAVSIM